MNVEEIMTRKVRTCRTSDTLATAAQRLWDGDCGCLPILSDDGSQHLVGIITDRDICMATHFRGARPADIAVGDVMSKTVRTVRPTERLEDAEAIMRDAQVRRLPVVDGRHELLGIVALADLAREADRSRKESPPSVSEDEIGEVLTSICSPRTSLQTAQTAVSA